VKQKIGWHQKNRFARLANSPDLNSIENLWRILLRRVYKNNTQYDKAENLRTAIEREWAAIEPHILETRVSSMSNRIFEITKKNGGYTKC
jgi:transposase